MYYSITEVVRYITHMIPRNIVYLLFFNFYWLVLGPV